MSAFGGKADIVRSGVLRLIFQPISKPAVNDLPLVANRPEIEKVRPICLSVCMYRKKRKAAHHS